MRCISSCACILLIAASFIGCKDELDKTAETSIEDFRIPDSQVAGWTESDNASAYSICKGEELYNAIDGGAQPYLVHGVQTTAIQVMASGESKSATVYAMDFGIPDSALSMYAFMKNADPDTTKYVANKYGADEAILYAYIGYYLAIAHFGRYFFQITLTGVSDGDEAVVVIEGMLSFLENTAHL